MQLTAQLTAQLLLTVLPRRTTETDEFTYGQIANQEMSTMARIDDLHDVTLRQLKEEPDGIWVTILTEDEKEDECEAHFTLAENSKTKVNVKIYNQAKKVVFEGGGQGFQYARRRVYAYIQKHTKNSYRRDMAGWDNPKGKKKGKFKERAKERAARATAEQEARWEEARLKKGVE